MTPPPKLNSYNTEARCADESVVTAVANDEMRTDLPVGFKQLSSKKYLHCHLEHLALLSSLILVSINECLLHMRMIVVKCTQVVNHLFTIYDNRAWIKKVAAVQRLP